MAWYYLKNQLRKGPVDDETFNTLVAQGDIKGETLVWQPGLEDWVPLKSLGTALVQSNDRTTHIKVSCVECNKPNTPSNMIHIENQWVCPACKDNFLIRFRQGTLRPSGLAYAGFWRRATAKLLDYGLLALCAEGYGMLLQYAFTDAGQEDIFEMLAIISAGMIGIIMQIVFNTWFISKFNATPGKMAMGIKVILPEGGRITYLRAFCRYLMEIVSGAIIYIGYLMAISDDRKRTLHDIVCDTRVVMDIKEKSDMPIFSIDTAGDTA